ncbi:ATP-binding protein [Acutalibacter intestini]|uniref:DNA polymerase III subunit n=1 Tax=Acutalibacter intestini TaxID=3093659 RepID=UPI002AC92BA8|nr:DNA polymerase III subunit [Acutalibacter sp. M00204]
MNFSSFAGNDGVKQALSAAFSAGRFPHAVILQGEPGTGKRTLAALLGKALVCRNRDQAPCGVCPSCVRAAAGSHPDLRVVEGSGVSKALNVDTIRAVLEDAYRMPDESPYNVYILNMGTRTLDAAQNKLLKLIEEPPQGAVFILICPSADSVLPTIRSRAQIFTLLPLEEAEAAQWLEREKQVDSSRAQELARLCGGNLGRMLEELENGGARRAFEVAVGMVDGMLSPGGHVLLKTAAPLQKDRALFRDVLARLALIFRDACVLRSGGETLLGGAPQAADRLCALPMKRLAHLPTLADQYREKLERNANGSLLVTCLCADLLSG